jgi:hypothetical protein
MRLRHAAAAGLALPGRWYLERRPLTIPHYYDFGEERDRVGATLASPDAWDALRETAGAFGLARERESWERSADEPELRARAEAIARVARRVGARRVCSYGVGSARLELQLHREAPDLELTCTEYAPRTVHALREVFTEATIVRHDLRADPPLDADLHVLHRLDAELSDAEWPAVFARFRQPTLVVAGTLLDWDGLRRELSTRRRDGATRAGWTRTPAGLERLWRGSHGAERLIVGDLPGYLLSPR